MSYLEFSFQKYSRPLIMAHKGDSERFPENSLLSIQNAVEMGVDVVETDIRLTKDNVFVLFHDSTLKRLLNLNNKISDFTLDELLDFNFGKNFTPDGKSFPYKDEKIAIVTLEDILKLFPKNNFNLDIKDPFKDKPDAGKILNDLLLKHSMEKKVIVASFHPKQLGIFRKVNNSLTVTSAHLDEVKKVIVSQKFRMSSILLKRMRFDGFQVPLSSGKHKIITGRFIKNAHKRKKFVHVWTINDKSIIERLIDLEVDGIFTDNPKLMMDLLDEKEML